jgi:hypothetical protein
VEEQSPYPKERGRTEPRPEISTAVVEQFTSTKENHAKVGDVDIRDRRLRTSRHGLVFLLSSLAVRGNQQHGNSVENCEAVEKRT